MDRNSDFRAEHLSLVPDAPLSRRGFVVTSLATGFAAAAGPVAAQTVIKTDTAGLDAKEVKIPTKDGQMPGYAAMPATGTGFPIVLVVQEVFGVHEHIRDICRRLAKSGYLAVAPELAGATIRPYTDLLLHDLGDGLADGRPEVLADGREWRTPPL